MKYMGPKQQKQGITGDKNWIFWDRRHRGLWAQDREGRPINGKRMTGPQKMMSLTYFLSIGFGFIEFLP
jgi:hypothetical protein